MPRRALTLALAVLALAAASHDVAAQSNIGCTAQLSPTALVFGNVSPHLPTGTTRLLGDVVVRCANGRNNPPGAINVSIGMSAGNSGTIAQRQMRPAGPGAPLLYNLYQDPALATVWSDNLGLNKVRLSVAPGTTGESRLPVYGAIPGGQTAVRPGFYSDTLNLTFRF
jgi:spore coat protein U-like protein